MTGPQDPAMAGGDRLRAGHADREQVIEALKEAFVHGRLTRDELETRAGQALASWTYGELAALTADLPAGPAAAPTPRQLARAHRAPGTHLVRNAAIGSGAGLIIAGALGAVAFSLDDHVGVALFMMAAFIVIVAVPSVMVSAVATSLQQRHSRGQLPPRPGQGDQAPEVQRLGQADHDPAQPGGRPDQTRTDVRTYIPKPTQPHSSGRATWTQRGVRTVHGAV